MKLCKGKNKSFVSKWKRLKFSEVINLDLPISLKIFLPFQMRF